MYDIELIRLTVQTVASLIAIPLGLFAAFRGLDQMRENRKQRSEELHWRRVKLAHDMLEDMWRDNQVGQALSMLSWKRQKYRLEDDTVVTLTRKQVVRALRISDLKFTDAEKHVRGCFSELFIRLGHIEHFINRKLIDFDDVSHVVVERIGVSIDDWDVLHAYMKKYRCYQAIALFQKLEGLLREPNRVPESSKGEALTSHDAGAIASPSARLRTQQFQSQARQALR